ncbi:IS110 family transposase [Saccharopolyspora shandongensis]|uniref:IS110 family transposase n=1 Tax=Saccharopolyspora shandongensis TaxID=418495 RepID=UPI0034457CD9
MTDQREQEQPVSVAGAQPSALRVVGGVDTHRDTHHAAVFDETGRQLADAEFPVTPAGYQELLTWLCGFGHIIGMGVEGTASYGAGLTRFLVASGVRVWEVNRPDRSTRRRKGKSDPLDAAAAARAVLAGQATAIPKAQNGSVEAVRVLHTVRAGAVKARTAAINTLRGLLVTADDELRARLRGLSATRLAAACAGLAPDDTADPATPGQAVRMALRELGHRIQALTSEITRLGNQLKALTIRLAPATTALFGVGPDTAAQLLITCGDNPDRLHSEAALAALTGTSPLPASSGRTDRHRLNRGGDRQANKALHQIILVRMRHDQHTRDYVHKRTQQGLSKKDIMRCLKRYLVRKIYRTITTDLALTTT